MWLAYTKPIESKQRTGVTNMSKHFTRTEAIAEAKALFGADWKNAAKIEHDGAFWCVSEQLYQITKSPKKAVPLALNTRTA